jgi:hypothetical protein
MPEKWSKWQRWTDVKCPHCGARHDLTPFDYLIQSGDQNPVFGCELTDDDGNVTGGCKRRFQVVAVDRPVLVRVRKTGDDAGGFANAQTAEERKAFEQTEAWKEMQKRKRR